MLTIKANEDADSPITLTMYYSLNIANETILNLGDPETESDTETESDEETLIITSPSSETENLFSTSDTAVLNIYKGVTLTNPYCPSFPAAVSVGDSSTLNLRGGQIINCKSSSNAGAISLSDYGVFNMYSGLIQNCTGGYGGAIGCNGSEIFFGENNIKRAVTVNIYGGKIKDCVSTNFIGGGAVCFGYNTNGPDFNMYGGTIDNCSVADSSTYGLGGAVFMWGNSNFTMTGGTIQNCSAKNGGAVFSYGSGSSSTVSTITIGGTAKLLDNTASESGGAISFQAYTKTVLIDGDAEISGNTAGEDGGAIRATASSNGYTLTIQGNAKITNNTADGYGGGVFASLVKVYQRDSAKISGNTAGASGGGICLEAKTVSGKRYISTFWGYGGEITDNKARNGGGIYQASGSGTLNLMKGSLSGNKATEYGGGILIEGKTTLSNGDRTGSGYYFYLYDNSAGTAGDDIYMTSTGIISIPSAPTVKTLGSCGHKITGYYNDDEDNRWTEIQSEGSALTSIETTGADITTTDSLALKAAHGYLLYVMRTNMTLESNISMNFFVPKGIVEAEKIANGEYYAKIIKHYSDNRDDRVETVSSTDWINYDSTYWGIKFYGVAAKEMIDLVEVQLFYTDEALDADESIRPVYTDSVQNYALRALNSDVVSDDFKRTVVDMLRYGAAAQVHFNYAVDNLATDVLTEEQMAIGTPDEPLLTLEDNRVTTETGSYRGTGLNLGNTLFINFYFNIGEEDINDLTAEISYEDYMGNTQTVSLSGEKNFYKHSRTLYSVRVGVLALSDLRQDVTCVLKNGEGTVLFNVTDSVASCVCRMNEVANEMLYQRILKLSDSAKHYFQNR